MIIDDKQLEGIIWIQPSANSWKIYVGDIPVLTTHSSEVAEQKVAELKDAVVVALKTKMVDMAGGMCDWCRREGRPTRVKATGEIYHYSRYLGRRECAAQGLWQALLQDTSERKEARGSLAERISAYLRSTA